MHVIMESSTNSRAFALLFALGSVIQVGQSVPQRIALRDFLFVTSYDLGPESAKLDSHGRQGDGTFLLILENANINDVQIHHEPSQGKLEVWASAWTKDFVNPIVFQNRVTFKREGTRLNESEYAQWQRQVHDEEAPGKKN